MNKQLISDLSITYRLGRTPLLSLAVAMLMLAGCATRSTQAPVEDRGNTPAPVEASAPVAPPKPLPGIENAGKPGYYTVKSGDTLIRISLESGQNWRDLVKWNNLDNPNLIEVGQVLRVVSPGVDASTVATKPVASTKVEPRSLDNKPVPPATVASGAAPASAPAAAPAVAPTAAPPAKEGEDDIPWAWPAAGAVVAPFDDTRHKGISVGGKAGDPVLAAADGRVVYAGSGLRGYGNLVIIKHNATYLTAYAHNQTLLVKEDQNVRRGQKIAEMGSTEADRVELHFEIRRQGRPIDPVKLLPAR